MTHKFNIPAIRYALAEMNRVEGAQARALLLLLATYADRAGVCWPSCTTLGERLDLHPGSVRRERARLVAAGLIALQYRGKKSTVVQFPVVAPDLAIVSRDAVAAG